MLRSRAGPDIHVRSLATVLLAHALAFADVRLAHALARRRRATRASPAATLRLLQKGVRAEKKRDSEEGKGT
jgi:hypothetical protein